MNVQIVPHFRHDILPRTSLLGLFYWFYFFPFFQNYIEYCERNILVGMIMMMDYIWT